MWRNHVADILGNKLKFTSSLSDPDLWYRQMVNTEGIEYCTYILVYLLKYKYTVKSTGTGEPKVYLGADISKAFHPYGT